MPRRLRTHHARTRPAGAPLDRTSPARRGYDRGWQHLRRWFLMRHPLCQHCQRDGRTTPATEVDHVVPIRAGGARLDQANLQALCKSCHSRKTVRDQRARGEGG
ncbi:MAG: HNH endonuclease [Phycisphaerales bacterium]|nr:HNH endonuclease [Phycisphaerales bacterium]